MNFTKPHKLLDKIRLVFEYGPELEELLRTKQEARLRKKRITKAHHLNLCRKHQQESSRSHFSECCCDYCNLLKGKKRNIDKDPNASTTISEIDSRFS